MKAKKYHLLHIIVLTLLFVSFLAALVLSQILLRPIKVDLTEKKLWTLTEGSKSILQNLNQPIEIKLFFSQKLSQTYPAIRNFSQRTRGLLLEIEKHAQGRVRIQYIDPEPFSQNEDRALSYGLRPLATIDDTPLYFGLVAENRQGGVETIPSFSIERQHQLEYDLIQIMHALEQEEKPSVGVISSLPLDTGIEGLPAALQGRAKPFLIYNQLAAHFQLEFLEQNIREVPSRIQTLFIAHPKKLNRQTLYAIDQFVLRGGKILLLVDPYCEISKLVNQSGKKIKGLGLTSSLEPLLSAWGIQYETRDVVADRTLAQRVVQQDSLRKSMIERDYILWLGANKNSISQEEVITRGLSNINLATSGHFLPKQNITAQFKPLITSSDNSMLFSTKYIQTPRTPDDLLAAFRAAHKKYILAAKLSGTLTSAFRTPPKRKKQKGETFLPHVNQSIKPTEIILVADSDLLEKRFWVNMSYYQRGIIVPTADNATFILNALDALMGNDALITLRARSPETRSFTQVDALRQQASQKLAREEYQLRQKIQTIQQRLAKFGNAPEKTQTGQEQLLGLERELLASRKALHSVRRELNRDIETLGQWVKFFNIFFIPVALLFLVMVSLWLKKSHYRK